jgi:integrase
MSPAQSTESDWLLVTSGGRSKADPDFHPLAREWMNVEDRERDVGIHHGQPILLRPDVVDYRIGDYFREAFMADRTSTARTYAQELQTWFRFLDGRRVTWRDATPLDVRAFQTWRVYDKRNPFPIQPSTWNKGWAALRHFYAWATAHGWIDENPAGPQSRLRDQAQIGGHREKNGRSSRDRWLTPSEFNLWRDVGLRGYAADRGANSSVAATFPDPSSRSRNNERNVAFVSYLVTTGLRLDEAGSLTTIVLPSNVNEDTPIVSKGGVRRHYRPMHDFGLMRLREYEAGSRKDAIRLAQKSGRYERMEDRLDVVEIFHGRRDPSVKLADGRTMSVIAASSLERSRLFWRGADGLQPLALWLTESGDPMPSASWERTFDSSNKRLTKARRSLGFSSPRVNVTPHSLRFSFALYVLLSAVRSIDERSGRSLDDPFLYRNYTQAFDEVKDLLGHSTDLITRRRYLEPLKGMRRSHLFMTGSAAEMWESLSRTSPLVGFSDESL